MSFLHYILMDEVNSLQPATPIFTDMTVVWYTPI